MLFTTLYCFIHIALFSLNPFLVLGLVKCILAVTFAVKLQQRATERFIILFYFSMLDSEFAFQILKMC